MVEGCKRPELICDRIWETRAQIKLGASDAWPGSTTSASPRLGDLPPAKSEAL
jgi:hypothetical protein